MTTKPILLETPIKRGETEITELQLRKPQSGELRGLSLAALANLDVDAVIKLLPRITTPSLTEVEAARLDPADLASCAVEIGSFLVSKRNMQPPSGLAEASECQAE